MEDILVQDYEAFFYCDGPTGQYQCIYGYSGTYDLECFPVQCAPPAQGAPIVGDNNCQFPQQRQLYNFNCNGAVRYGGSPFSCFGPYT